MRATVETVRADVAEVQELKELNRRQTMKIEQLQDQLASKEMELRELKYETQKKSLEDREVRMEHVIRIDETKQRQQISNLKKSLDSIEKMISDRGHSTAMECDRILRLLAGLERHTLHGRHTCASRTATDLMAKIRSGLEGLKGMVKGRLAEPPLKTETPPSSQHSSKSDMLDNALLDLCNNLEDENAKLEATVTTLKQELEDATREAAVSKLIPHYRLAIVRYSVNLFYK